MAFIKKSQNILKLSRAFSNKGTINLDSKLAREEVVLIVDEEDNPVR